MPSGSCLCGSVKIDYPDSTEADIKCLCHCLDCRKISGSVYSTNVIIPGDEFKVTGTPKSYKKVGDSGGAITSFFCGECGSTLFRESDMFKGKKIIKCGVLDGEASLIQAKPKVELYARSRVAWVPQAQGTQDMETA